MAATAAFRTFDAEVEEWQLYREQLEQFFVTSKVTDDMKKAVLINHLSSKTYKLLRDLCTPDQPKDKSFADLCKMLTTHFTPPVVIHKERRLFFRAKRHENGHETVNQWIVRIKNLAANCRFGDALTHNLINKFVDGLDGKAYDRVCEEDEKLTLEKAQELALKYESDDTAIQLMFVKDKKHVNTKANSSGKSEQRLDYSRGKCLACGRAGHYRRDCRFKEYVCKKCNKKGHLQAACEYQRNFYLSAEHQATPQATPQDGDNRNNETDQVNLQQNYISKCGTANLYNLSEKDRAKDWFKIEVMIGIDTFMMELDSGAGLCVISEEFYRQKLNKWPLEKSGLQLQLYSGDKMQVAGVVFLPLTYSEKTKQILFAVVNGRGPPLLGKNFMKAFNMQLTVVNNVAVHGHEAELARILQKHENLFSNELGCYAYGKINLQLTPDAQPTFKKPRQVPFKFRDQVAGELDKMEREGIITKCDSSEWGTPLVPVVKPDSSIRLCGDYKVTLNSYLQDVKHPLPTAEEIFSKLNGGRRFSKLDLSKAYNQFELDDDSKEMCAISTTQGVYRMNRLPFGVKPASGIVQREIEKLLCGVEGVSNFLDDVLITGATDEEHLRRLEQVFSILEKAGLRLNKDKCQFFKDRVTFVGYVITENGLQKTDDRIAAIRDAPEPVNVTEVRAFAGLVNYYAKFINGLADIMSPLYHLLRKGVKFEWSDECRSAFQKIKSEICKDVTLAHFNPTAEIILTCDASNKGISAVLSQKEGNVERAVAFASRILHPSEVNYSVIDREALAIVYGVNKFYQYLAGNHFCIRTDHKPLLSIFSPKKGIPTIAASRMQRWAHFLSGFSYDIGHVRSQSNIADFSSRFPVESWKIWKEEDSYLNFINTDECGLVDVSILADESGKDAQLSQVIEVLRGTTSDQFLEGNPYLRFMNEFSLEKGVVMRGCRVVVPVKLRNQVLKKLHQSHLGIVKSKSVARSCVWWPNIDQDIERFSQNCSPCLLQSSSPPKSELIPWKPPSKVWSRIHVDFAGPVKGSYFLIIIDALSKWVEVYATKSCTAQFVLEKLTECISRFGIFDELVSDNGSQFLSGEVQKFLTANGIQHKLTSPGHPATNGEAENMVKTFKSSLLKCLYEQDKSVNSIIANFLMGYRKAIHCSTGLSPAQMMLGRDIRSALEIMNPCRKPDTQEEQTAKENVLQKQKVQMQHYRGTRKVTFNVGDKVVARDYTNPNKEAWTPAVVEEILGNRNYRVQLSITGRRIKRHVDQIKKDSRENILQSDTTGITRSKPSLPRCSSRSIPSVPVKRTSTIARVDEADQVEDAVDTSAESFSPASHSSPMKPVGGDGQMEGPRGVNSPSGSESDLAEETDLFVSLSESLVNPKNSTMGSKAHKAPNESFHQTEIVVSDDSMEGLEVAGFERGNWRLRDEAGRVFKK